MATKGASVSLECKVSAQPLPQMAFWRDPHGRIPVIQGPKYDIKIVTTEDVSVIVIFYNIKVFLKLLINFEI